MKVWITDEKNIVWMDDGRFGYFQDVFWNPPPIGNKDDELIGWMILE